MDESVRENERRRLKSRNDSRYETEGRSKIDCLHSIIRHQGIAADPEVVKRAEKTITSYEKETIIAAEAAFIKAVNRKSERSTLPYFFGILRNIQKERDDKAYGEYCREKYNYHLMEERRKTMRQLKNEPPSINSILNMLEKGLTLRSEKIRRVCLGKAKEWTMELMKNYQYLGVLRKKFDDAIGELKHLGSENKEQMMKKIKEFVNPKSGDECVTCSG